FIAYADFGVWHGGTGWILDHTRDGGQIGLREQRKNGNSHEQRGPGKFRANHNPSLSAPYVGANCNRSGRWATPPLIGKTNPPACVFLVLAVYTHLAGWKVSCGR